MVWDLIDDNKFPEPDDDNGRILIPCVPPKNHRSTISSRRPGRTATPPISTFQLIQIMLGSAG